MRTRAERQAARREARQRFVGAIRDLRPLDDDDREALARLIATAAEVLSDGEITLLEVEELARAVGALREARQTSDLAGLAAREDR